MALEQETDAILRILAERTIGDSVSCRLEALIQADVPKGIKSFFWGEIRRRLEGDLGKSPWFTGIRESDVGAARVARALVVSLTGAYQFTRQEFLDTLDLGVHFVANYLCRPQWTLENFLFDRGPRISLRALAEGLLYVSDYRYLGDIVLRSLQRRGLNEIGREDFHQLLAKIDEEVVRQHNARELASLTRPLFTFFQIAGTQPAGAIPVESLLVFFEDKKLRVLKEYIRGISQLRNRPQVTFEELTQLIEELFAGKPVAISEPAPPSPAPAPSVAPVTPASTPIEAPEMETPPPPAPERNGPSGEQPKANIALSLTFAGLRGSVVARQPLPEIKTLIQPEQRDRFVSNVFKGDAAHYAGALVVLDALKTRQDAEAFLAELYRTNNIDPHTADALEFSDTIRRRYAISERVP